MPVERISDLVRMAQQVDELHREWHEEMPSLKATVLATERRVDRVENELGIRDSDRRIPIDLGDESPTGHHRIVPRESFAAMFRAYEREQDGRVWRSIKRSVRRHAGKALVALAAAGCTHLGHPYLAKMLGGEESHERR